MKNNRTFLEKLLDGAEVEWKTLGEVSELRNTGVDKKINESEKSVRLLNFTDVFNNQYLSNSTPIMIVTASDKKIIDCNILKGDLFITPTSEILDEIGQSAVALENIDNAVYSYHIMRIRIHDTNFLLPEFLNYLFRTSQIKQQIRKNAQGITRFGLTLPRWKSLVIPIPPLPVQTEIVKILDTLTALTSELTSELTLRRKQYEYYREKLLSEEELIKLGATTENLGDITSITSGGTPSTKEPAYWVEGNIPWIKSESCKNKLIDEIKHHITEMGLQNSNAKLLSPNTTLMAMVGATIFKTAFLPFEATTNQNIAAIKSKNELSITDKFIFYYLTNMYDFFISKLSGYNMVNLSQIKNIKILLPPLEEQQRIVSILDKFEALTNSITEGLPLAIEQSQKRYEYYRELLLNFS